MTQNPAATRSHLPRRLTYSDAFRFPVGTPEARRDVLIGGLAVIFLLVIGWILNLGARLDVVQRLYHDDRPYFRGFKPWRRTFRRGCISAATIFCYLSPCLAFSTLSYFGYRWDWPAAVVGSSIALAVIAFVLGVFTLPGCMTVYACEGDPAVLRKPAQAFRRAVQHRQIYFKAWRISLAAVVLSIFGVLGLVVGFIFTSVWAWEVVGYAFTVAMYSDARSKNE